VTMIIAVAMAEIFASAAAAGSGGAPPPLGSRGGDGIPVFGVAGHFAYQQPYGRDNQPFSPWPINTTEQLRVLHKACGSTARKRRCVFKTDWPVPADWEPGKSLANSSDPHVQYMRELVAAAASMDIEVMAAIGMGESFRGGTGAAGAAAAEEFGFAMASVFDRNGSSGTVTHWQVSDEFAVPHCGTGIDYKHHWGMAKADYNATCMRSWCAVISAVIRGIHRANPAAVAMPVAMGWARLGVWKWVADEHVPLDAIGLDWYSDAGRINCTCRQYPPVDCGHTPALPCINVLAELEELFPGKPVWITEFNRKAGSCNGSDAIGGAARCGSCADGDKCAVGLANQAQFVAQALAEWEELSAAYQFGGVVLYELLDQPHLYPSSEALYGLVRVAGKGQSFRVAGEKPVFAVVEKWNRQQNTSKSDGDSTVAAAPAPLPPPPPTTTNKCRAGTFPLCYPASETKGWVCMTAPGAAKDAIGKAIQWACGAGGVDCSAIDGAAGHQGACWDSSKPAAQQSLASFGDYVFQKYWSAHCMGGKPPPATGSCPGPDSPSATSCGFGGAARLRQGPVLPVCAGGKPSNLFLCNNNTCSGACSGSMC
jgi:hypothetical protein